MENRTIIVTGSSSGIGQAITKRFLSAGATVIGLARKHHQVYALSDKYQTFEFDMAQLKNIPDFIQSILISHPKLDGFVSSAGSGLFDNLENLSLEQISSYINTNLISQIAMTKYLIPHFKSKKQGDIVFIGSEAALKGAKKSSLYSAAKFGLRGFSQSLREECSSSNVRVSIVNPGMVRTPFFRDLTFNPGDDPENAIEPEDLAEIVYTIFAMRPGTLIDEVNVTPQKKVVNHGPKGIRSNNNRD